MHVPQDSFGILNFTSGLYMRNQAPEPVVLLSHAPLPPFASSLGAAQHVRIVTMISVPSHTHPADSHRPPL